MKPDALIQVQFKTTAEGGRQTAVGGGSSVVDYYGCAFVIDGEAFDCRLLLTGDRLELGQTYEVQVKFLNPHFVLPKLVQGKPFILREGKDVASGKVIRVLGSA